jgi:hypothetical protein
LTIRVSGFGDADKRAERIEEDKFDGHLSALINVGRLPVRSEMIPWIRIVWAWLSRFVEAMLGLLVVPSALQVAAWSKANC